MNDTQLLKNLNYEIRNFKLTPFEFINKIIKTKGINYVLENFEIFEELWKKSDDKFIQEEWSEIRDEILGGNQYVSGNRKKENEKIIDINLDKETAKQFVEILKNKNKQFEKISKSSLQNLSFWERLIIFGLLINLFFHIIFLFTISKPADEDLIELKKNLYPFYREGYAPSWELLNAAKFELFYNYQEFILYGAMPILFFFLWVQFFKFSRDD